MKKYAWTMAELIIAIAVILVLTGLAVKGVKNMELNKSKIYLYAAIRQLTMATIAVTEKNDFQGIYPSEAKTWDDNNTTDWYCIKLADVFALKSSVSCGDSTASGTANFTTSNGIAFYGVASGWKNAYGSVYYKDVMVDINNSDKPNKIGHDRFPLRVFRGTSQSGISLDAMVYPVDCPNDKVDNGSSLADITKHAYCGSSTSKFASNDSFVTYDILKVTSPAYATPVTSKKATKIKMNLPFAQADCYAYGNTGFYGGRGCSNKSFKIISECAHYDTCVDCSTYGICPSTDCNTLANKKDGIHVINYNDQESSVTEDVNIPCFILMSKPTGGLGLIGGSLISEFGI